MRTLSDEDIDKIVERLNKTFIETTKELGQENKQLKEELQKADSITQSCIFEGKEETTINFRECLNTLVLYKEVIDEVRESKDEYVCTEEYCGEVGIKTTQFIEKLGQILDKAKENK